MKNVKNWMNIFMCPMLQVPSECLTHRLAFKTWRLSKNFESEQRNNKQKMMLCDFWCNIQKDKYFVYLNGIKLLRSNDHWLLLLMAPNMRKGSKSWVVTWNKGLISNKKVRKIIFFFRSTFDFILYRSVHGLSVIWFVKSFP